VIPLRTTVTCAERSDNRIALRTEAAVAWPSVELERSRLAPTRSWADHLLGVVVAVGREVGPCTLEVRSEVPLGAGLGSSAALAVATARALRDAYRLELDDRRIAEIAHRSETTFVGARVGRMDQLVSSLGERGSALLIDFRTLSVEKIALPAAIDLAVIDSGIRHEHARGAYNERRAECESAAKALGLASLRDAGSGAWLHDLPETLRRRVRHVTSENARVRAFVRALERGEIGTLGEIVDASHASLRDDFAVSIGSSRRREHPARSARGWSVAGSADACSPSRAPARAAASRTRRSRRPAWDACCYRPAERTSREGESTSPHERAGPLQRIHRCEERR